MLIEGHLVMPGAPVRAQSMPYAMGMYRDVRRILQNNLLYIGNIRALQHWYQAARSPYMTNDPYRSACYHGAQIRLESGLQERIHRLEGLINKLPRSIEQLLASGLTREDRRVRLQESLLRDWPVLKQSLQGDPVPDAGEAMKERLLTGFAEAASTHESWTSAVQSLPPESRQAGVAWLQGIVDSVSALWHST